MSAEAKVAGRYDCREAFAKAIEALAEKDERIVTVVNDSVGSSKLVGFQKRFPDRLINVGIAEQAMVGVGAGLANGGKVPFVSGASCFLTARARADQGRRCLHEHQRQAVRHVERRRLWRTRPDAPLDRGFRVAAAASESDHHRPFRSLGDRRSCQGGRGHRRSLLSAHQPDACA
jgi:Transketolase, pyrimidine binding domain